MSHKPRSDRRLREAARVNYREVSVDEEDHSTDSEEQFFSEFDGSLDSPANTLESTAVAAEDIGSVSLACDLNFVAAPEGDSFEVTPVSTDTMAQSRVTQLSAELGTLLFQIDEIAENVSEEIQVMSLEDATEQYSELKELRINMIRVQKELALLANGDNYAAQVAQVIESSKNNMKILKTRINALEKKKDQVEEDRLQEVKEAEEQKNKSRKLAFETMANEVKQMYMKLNDVYAAPARNLTRDEMLRRKDERPALALEFDRFRERVDKLVCDVETQFPDKERIVQELVHYSGLLGTTKATYEKRVYDDLLANDLTEDKLKLAELTSIDIGKFGGSDGEDFYTFKSKFLKVYAHHPKGLMVEWLRNNHLQGRAKECIGSLEDIDHIWQRLKDNFGNTERMLSYHFQKINLLGPMNRKKSYTDKKFYLQTIINSMQDASDLAEEHGLTGELHYGLQLQKIVQLLETHLQNGWYKIVATENLGKPQRWLRMVIYLEAQLTVIQTRALETESADLDAARSSSLNNRNNDSRAKNNNLNNRQNQKSSANLVQKELCSLCDDSHPSANKGLLSCKKFLLMTHKERGDHLCKKKICLQCLDATTKWNDPAHKCSDTWVCPNEFHKKFDKKNHILVCSSHVNEEDNKKLLELFVSQFLTAPWQQRIAKSPTFIAMPIPSCSTTKSSVLDPKNDKKHVLPTSSSTACMKKMVEVPDDSDYCNVMAENTDLPDATSAPPPVFILQPAVMPELHPTRVFNLMFDNGCSDMCSRKEAVDSIPEKYKANTIPGPLIIQGVGGVQATSPYGHYLVQLPIHDGRLAKFSGICLDAITSPMPPYPVREASKEIVEAYRTKGGDIRRLPNVPAIVGGHTDFLIGVRYNYFQPQLVFMLPTGLAIYKSIFRGVDGTRGCIGGSSEIFDMCERQFTQYVNLTISFKEHLQQQLKLYKNGIKICVDVNAISLDNSFPSHNVAVVNEECGKSPAVLVASSKRLHNEAEEAGSIIEYRCIGCRGCSDCKKGEYIEKVSLREEYEQHVIDNSVMVDFDAQLTSASLPFVKDPVEKLESNERNANKIYAQQVKKLNKLPAAKEAVLASEMKLQSSGHVEWVKNLTGNELDVLNSSLAKYYMPWRFVFNENSITTPVRIVFDASSVSRSGMSLNDVLAKGINTLNSLLEIFLRFRCNMVALHTDVAKMYNVIKLKPEHWTFQRYKWQESLDPSVPSQDKIIKTLIYGVKPSGNQATVGLRGTARKQQNEKPAAVQAIIEDIYMDDCATGVNGPGSHDSAEKLATDIEQVLLKGGFVTKGFTKSGSPPPLGLSKDGESINVLGSKWLSERDKLKLNIGPLNFAKKNRGKRDESEDAKKVPDKLTKAICAGKVAEIFDINGFVAPIVAGFKMCISKLNPAVGWEDRIPDLYRNVWLSNFQKIQCIGDLVYNRAVVPEDALSMDVELISAGDASERMTCAATYIRFKLKSKGYSCQLILAKTKVVPEGTTLPRAELMAATLNVHVSEIVRRSLRNNIVDSLLVLDSEIVLFWLSSVTKQLKPFVRNRVIEILRFSHPSIWRHIASHLNPADLGTRDGVAVEDCSQDSDWINGLPWMLLPMTEIRDSYALSLNDIQIRNEHAAEIKKESMKSDNDLCNSEFHLVTSESVVSTECYVVGDSAAGDSYITDSFVFGCYPVSEVTPEHDMTAKVKERLQFSKYIINPNKFNFYKVVRIHAIVMKFAEALCARLGKTLSAYSYLHRRVNSLVPAEPIICSQTGTSVVLSDAEMQYSFDYFFRKATEEIKRFVQPKVYENLTREENGILYYSARVSPSDVKFQCPMTPAMLDLSAGTFVVPMVDRHSPLAYGIVNQIHWYHPTACHKGVETTIRHVMTVAHIISVRDLAKMFRRRCARCRFLLKMTVDVEMAPASEHQVCVAPPFYVTQADLCGSFEAFSKHNKRTTVKIWIVTFVCSTTTMTSLKVMEGYDTTQFLQAFSRFACEFGFPKQLLVDAGSQLLSGCENMVLDFTTMRGVLNREYGILFDVCPVGGHNYHGKVERKIQCVKDSIMKSARLQRLSILQWETLCAEISNSINNLPIAIGNETQDLESLDLITPNRLRLGRNNDRSPIGSLDVSGSVDRILQLNSDIFNSWWETWLTSALPKIVPQPKWYRNDEHLKVGDIVLFKKAESSFVGQYKYGIVDKVHFGADGHVRAASIRYRNASDGVERIVERVVRSLVVIHRINELDIMEELGKATFFDGASSPAV